MDEHSGSGAETRTSHRGARAVRAAGIGLTLGMLAGGLVLMAFAAQGLLFAPDCAALMPEECAFAQRLTRQMAMRQALFGGALAMLGPSLVSLLRRR